MPVRDCITGSPFCPEHYYEEFHDPVLSKHPRTTLRKGLSQGWIPKHSAEAHKGEHNGKLWKFAEDVHKLKEKTQHHM
jgi:hypothetical protein